VRSFNYKYIWTDCITQDPEQFFDLNADPDENFNQIENSFYAAVIDSYRTKLANYKTALKYKFNPKKGFSCQMVDNFRQQNPEMDDEDDDRLPLIQPNPSGGVITLNNPFAESAFFEVLGAQGQLILAGKISAGRSQIDLSSLTSGLYKIRITSSSGKQETTSVMIAR